MDPFSACVAFGPLAIYLLALGLVNLSRRPLVVAGTRETLSLGLGLAGLVTIGPMQLFMPQEAAGRFGYFVWPLLLSFYALSLSLVIMLSRQRLVIYNISEEQLRPRLDAAVRRIDPDAVWAGPAVNLPLARIQFQVENFAPFANLSLVATGDDQSATAWRRLEGALRSELGEIHVAHRSPGIWLTLAGLMILMALVFWVADDPRSVAQGFQRVLNP
jgi:hypothetical protein